MERILLRVEDTSQPPSITAVGHIRVGEERARYDLFFTDRRLVAAVVFSTSDLLPLANLAVPQVLTYGRARKRRREAFRGKSPEEILALHAASLAIPYGEVPRAHVKRGWAGARLEVELGASAGGRRFRFSLPRKRAGEVRQHLSLYLGGRLEG